MSFLKNLLLLALVCVTKASENDDKVSPWIRELVNAGDFNVCGVNLFKAL